MTEAPPDDEARRLGWRTPILVLIFYAACIVGAATRVAATFATALPASLADPMQHLWVMRWYKTCLLEGRSPVLCPDVQYPVGAPLGNFSPMHLQSLIYLPLSLFVKNDIIIYNILWYLGFLTTGLGAFLLAWRVAGDRAGAALAGLAAMLCAPMTAQACGHLELIHLGSFPMFLAAWVGFVDRPSRGRLFASAAWYVLVAMSAAYFTVLAVFPAALYAAWAASRAGRRGMGAWLRERWRWAAAFVATTGPILVVLFAGQLWASLHGHALTRSRDEFDLYRAPLWGYVVPTVGHRLGRLLLPFDPYEAAGFGMSAGERCSYLGLATLVLAWYAARRRAAFPRASYWWAALALTVVLSLGSYWQVGRAKVPLPSGWLWDVFFAFRLIRVPSRFNLLAAVIAAVIAAVGLRELLGRFPRAWQRAAAFAGITAFVVFDLAGGPGTRAVPAMPACYAELTRRDPRATFCDVVPPGDRHLDLTAACAYWQSIHRGRTTAAYSGHLNMPFTALVTYSSPFAPNRMEQADYLRDPGPACFDYVSKAEFLDYAWLFLKAHDLRYVVVHRDGDSTSAVDRLGAALASAKISENRSVAVFDRDRLATPTRPVLLCKEGWRLGWEGRVMRVVGREARVAYYNPDPARPLTLTLEARGFHRARVVRLLDGSGRELAHWDVPAGAFRKVASPPLRLPAGPGELTLACDGESRPRQRREFAIEWDPAPFSLHVSEIALTHTEAIAARLDSITK